MTLLNHTILPRQNPTARLAKAAWVAFVEVIVFFAVFLFLLLNTLGT